MNNFVIVFFTAIVLLFTAGCGWLEDIGMTPSGPVTTTHVVSNATIITVNGESLRLSLSHKNSKDVIGEEDNGSGTIVPVYRQVVDFWWDLNIQREADEVGFTYQLIRMTESGSTEIIVGERKILSLKWHPPESERDITYVMFLRIKGSTIESDTEYVTVPGV